MALCKLADLLLNEGEFEAACAEFHAADNSDDKLSREVRELINDDVRIGSLSQANYSLRCWDNTWQCTIAELTIVRDALHRRDTAGTLLRDYYPEMLDPICKIEPLPDLDWVSLEPKKGCRKKCLAKQWLNKRAYDKLIDTVNTLSQYQESCSGQQ